MPNQARKQNTTKVNSGTPWNKGKKQLQTAWNKGVSKETSKSVEKISNAMLGPKNPMFGKRHSDEYRTKQSDTIRRKIEIGKFTPNSNNRQTHYDVEFAGKKFRSSWEAAYYSLNPNMLHEKLRLPYTFNGKQHIYLVDFVDHNAKVAVEVKPRELLTDKKTQAKLSALREWCASNSYRAEVVTQDYFWENWDQIDIELFDSKTQQKLKGLYEAKKKNRS